MNIMCHREGIEAVEVLPTQVKDIGELLDESTKNEKALNRAMFKRICAYLDKDWLLQSMEVEKTVISLNCYN